MIFIDAQSSIGRDVRNQGHRPRTFDGVRQLALMPSAAARDASGDDLSALGDEVAEATDVLVVDEVDLVRAEFADLAPAEPAALDRLLRRGNG
jgi:hypothetical protein